MGVKELWKLFREEDLMREWSYDSDGAGAQKAVADQIEGNWPESSPAVTDLYARTARCLPRFLCPLSIIPDRPAHEDWEYAVWHYARVCERGRQEQKIAETLYSMGAFS